MEEDFLVYELFPGETPEKVAALRGMTAAELLDFHNAHCASAGLLWISGFVGVQKIIVPARRKSPGDLRKMKQKFLPSKSFSPEALATKYHISEKLSMLEKADSEITYDLILKFASKNIDGQPINTVEQQRLNFRKNGQVPDDKISSLALDCIQSISPVEFVMSEDGKLAEIFDYESVLRRFKQKKAAITDFHVGEIAEAYIAKFEENIADEDFLFSQLGRTLLNQILFPGNAFYLQDGTFEKKMKVIPNSFPVKILFECNYEFEDQDFTSINLCGDIIEPCTLQELLHGKLFETDAEESLKGTVNISYDIRKSNLGIQQVSAEIVLYLDEEVYYQYNLKISNDGQ